MVHAGLKAAQENKQAREISRKEEEERKHDGGQNSTNQRNFVSNFHCSTQSNDIIIRCLKKIISYHPLFIYQNFFISQSR